MKPWEQHPVRTLHACVDTLASAFKGYLPWPDDKRGQVERGHEMLIEDTVKRADACLTIIEHAQAQRPSLGATGGEWIAVTGDDPRLKYKGDRCYFPHILIAGKKEIIVNWAQTLADCDKLAIEMAARWNAASLPVSPRAAPEGLHPATTDLVQRFAAALAEKLRAAEVKYGYSDFWKDDDWQDECRAKLLHHLAKGDPRDVANYCAFMWHHGWSTTPLSHTEPSGVLWQEPEQVAPNTWIQRGASTGAVLSTLATFERKVDEIANSPTVAQLAASSTGPLLAEYRRRAQGLNEAIERSRQMERDFLEKKVLNAQANEAMDEVSAKQRIFTVWLLQVSDDLIAECLAVSATATKDK